MKKFLLFAIALTLSVGANAQMLAKSQQKQAIATQMRMGENFAKRMYDNGTRARRVMVNAESEIDTCYLRPKGTYYWASDASNHGFIGYLVPAMTDMTWRNATQNAPENAQWGWYTIDHDSAQYYLRSTDYDFVENEIPSLLKNYFQIGTDLYWLQARSSNPPILVLNDSEDYYEFEGLIQYGGTPRIMTDTTQALFANYPVTSYCQFSEDWMSFNAGYFYMATNEWQYGANDVNNDYWLPEVREELFENDPDNVTEVKLTGVTQLLDAPNAPYLLNAVNWAFGYYSSNKFGKPVEVTLSIYKVVDNGDGLEMGDLIATSVATLPVKKNTTSNSFVTVANFPLTTIADDGGEEDGIVIDDAVALVVSGFAEGFESNAFQILTTPVVGQYRPKALVERRFDAAANLDVTYNGETRPLLYDVSFGYYLDDEEPNDSVYYITNFRYTLDMEMPWLTPETTVVELDGTGAEVVLPVSACRSSDEWTVTLEDGSDLPGWLTIDYNDEMYRDVAYNQNTELTFSAEALPEGVTGREAKVKLSYRGCAETVITVKQGEGGEAPSKVYVIGDAPLGGWNPAAPIEMTENEETAGLFTYTVNVEEAKDIYFVFTEGIGSWDEVNAHRYGPTEANQDVVMGEDMTTQLSTNDQAAYKLAAAVAGEYTFTFNKNEMKFRVDGPEVEPDYVLHYGKEGVEWQDVTFVAGEGDNEGKLVAADVAFEANTQFGVKYGETWYAGLPNEGEDNYVIHYGWCTDIPLSTGDNVKNFLINEAGTYTFLLTVGEEGNTLTVNGFTAPGVLGDVTGDGEVDIADVNAIINIMLQKNPASDYPGNADVSGDGSVDIADVNAVINIMLGKV